MKKHNTFNGDRRMNKTDTPEQKNDSREIIIKHKDYLLEKIYDKYKMEIARKDRLESKAIGYYTVIGISFAAFLVVEPILFDRGYLPKLAIKDILAILNLLITIAYLAFFIFLITKLHQSYTPKIRAEFESIRNWDVLIGLQDESYIESIKNNLIEIIKEYEESNSKMANRIQVINNLCFINMLLVVAVLIILAITYFV